MIRQVDLSGCGSFAASNQRVDRLGECLLRAGVLTLEQLRDERRFSPERFSKCSNTA
jgi:hypothetical protein